MNRYTRDAIIDRALDMLDSPTLNAKERPGGVLTGTMAVGWLQDALDLFHHEFPWQGVVKKLAVTLDTTGLLTLPSDFVLDVRDGLVIAGHGRLMRTSLQRFITLQITTATSGDVARYVVRPPQIEVLPMPRANTAATLWYYSLPAVMTANVLPNFPSDWLLIEYVRLRGREWHNMLPPGSAVAYAREEINRLRIAGLANEPEDDRIPLDRETFVRPGGRNDWMGGTTTG